MQGVRGISVNPSFGVPQNVAPPTPSNAPPPNIPPPQPALQQPKIETIAPEPPVAAKPVATDKQASDPIDFIFNSEARKDKGGIAQIYKPPANDGGIIEVAGITKAQHPEAYGRISALEGDARNQAVKQYLREYTDPGAKWANNPAAEAIVRDTYFHRGPTGSQKIIQMALGDKMTGTLTSDQLSKLQAMTPEEQIDAITNARQKYEDTVIGVRPNLAKGLANRFQNAREFALGLIPSPTS